MELEGLCSALVKCCWGDGVDGDEFAKGGVGAAEDQQGGFGGVGGGVVGEVGEDLELDFWVES